MKIQKLKYFKIIAIISLDLNVFNFGSIKLFYYKSLIYIS